jgi:hypothetical protein
MFAFLNSIRKRRIERYRQAGYDHAAGELLRGGEGTLDRLEHHVELSRSFGRYDHFDIGVEEAIEQWLKLRNEEL